MSRTRRQTLAQRVSGSQPPRRRRPQSSAVYRRKVGAGARREATEDWRGPSNRSSLKVVTPRAPAFSRSQKPSCIATVTISRRSEVEA
jgi:hypothetical protein